MQSDACTAFGSLESYFASCSLRRSRLWRWGWVAGRWFGQRLQLGADAHQPAGMTIHGIVETSGFGVCRLAGIDSAVELE